MMKIFKRLFLLFIDNAAGGIFAHFRRKPDVVKKPPPLPRSSLVSYKLIAMHIDEATRKGGLNGL